jgi:tRNA modification GTPase
MPGYDLTDTIFAPATPLTASAIGIVRLSGERAWQIASGLLRGLPTLASIEPQHAYVCHLPLADGVADTCVALFWRAPNSYSGEDLAELMLHGSPLLLRQVQAQCQLAGARLAEAGEFTYRAYLNGKLDLAQADAVQELISAPSSKALTLAAAQLAGLPGKRIRGWIDQLQDLLANIEVIHDYAADDLDASLDQATLLTTEKLQAKLRELVAQMDSALEASQRTQQLRSGVTVAICGPPNVGKSTLFNALLGHERALTAPEPGTTRDYLSETLETAGVRLTLVDTAGYRETADAVEAAGVAHAQQWLTSADKVLWVQAADATEPVGIIANGLQVIPVITRCDLLPDWEQMPLGSRPVQSDPQCSATSKSPNTFESGFLVSGLTGRGVPELWQALLASSGELDAPALESLGTRQSAAVSAARESLQTSLTALDSGMAMDAAASDIYASLEQLHGVFQQADRNRVIEQVFSGFCVGK